MLQPSHLTNIWWCGNYIVANAIIKIYILYYCWYFKFITKWIYKIVLVNYTPMFQLCENELEMSALAMFFKSI